MKYRLTIKLEDRDDICLIYNSTKEIANDLNISLSNLYKLMSNQKKYKTSSTDRFKYITIEKLSKNDIFETKKESATSVVSKEQQYIAFCEKAKKK